MTAEMPACQHLGPWTVPGKTVAIDKLTLAKHLHLLDDALKAKQFGDTAARVAPRNPQVAPDEMCTLAKLHVDALKVSATCVRNRWPRQDHEHGSVRNR